MALLTDAEAAEIRREVESGMRGPILVRWIELLLEDRAERVRLERAAAPPAPHGQP